MVCGLSQNGAELYNILRCMRDTEIKGRNFGRTLNYSASQDQNGHRYMRAGQKDGKVLFGLNIILCKWQNFCVHFLGELQYDTFMTLWAPVMYVICVQVLHCNLSISSHLICLYIMYQTYKLDWLCVFDIFHHKHLKNPGIGASPMEYMLKGNGSAW